MEIEVKSEHLITNSSRMMKELLNENNQLIDRASEARDVHSNDILSSFKKLLTVIQGIPPRKELFELEATVIHNIGCLLLRQSADVNTSMKEGFDGPPGLAWNDQLRKGEIIFIDMVNRFSGRVQQMRNVRLEALDRSNDIRQSSHRLVFELVSPWYPTSAKVALLNLILVQCFHLVTRRCFKEALDVCSLLVQNVLDDASGLLVSPDNSIRPMLFNLFNLDNDPILTLQHLQQFVHTTVAVCYLCDDNWLESLKHLQMVESGSLSIFCKYIEAFIFYKRESFEMAVAILGALIERDDMMTWLSLDAKFLLGNCLSAQKKHRLAIQIYKKCLQQDFDFLLPLFQISVEYRKLNLFDAEIESMALLTKLLQESGSTCRDLKHPCLTTVLAVMPSAFSTIIRLDRSQTLFTLAQRCFELGRFDSASDHYSELLTVLTGEDCVQNKAANPECSVVTLPRVGCIYKQAIVCHIRANNFDTAISVCQHFLSKTTNSSEPSSSEASGGIASRQSKTKRSRKHVNDGGSILSYSSTEDRLLESEILALRADAMCKTDFKDEALSTLTKSIEIVEQCWMAVAKQDDQMQDAKRCKTDDGGRSRTLPSDVDDDGRFKQILSDIYHQKGRILAETNRLHDAMHWCRMANQLDPKNSEKAYSLASLLSKQNNTMEAATFWLAHLGYSTSAMDDFQIEMLLKQRSDDPDRESLETEKTYRLFDIELLKALRSCKHGLSRHTIPC